MVRAPSRRASRPVPGGTMTHGGVTRRQFLAGAAATVAAIAGARPAQAKGSVTAAMYPGTWEEAFRAHVVPAALRRLRARSGSAGDGDRPWPVREVRREAAAQRRPAARRHDRRLGRHRRRPGRRHRLQPQEAAAAEELDRPPEGSLGLPTRHDGLPDHLWHRVDHRDRQAVRGVGDERRAVLRGDQEGAVQGVGHRRAGVDAGAVPAGPVRHHVHQHADGGHPARARRGHRLRETRERSGGLLHHHARRQGIEGARQRLQVFRHGDQRARADGADAAAQQLHPGEPGREAGRRPADGVARRDGQVRPARLVDDQPAACGLDRALQQGSRQVRGLRPAEWQLALPLALAYAAFFLVPLLLLIAVSAFDDETLTTAGFAQWRKFLADPFTWKVIVDTIKLGGLTVAATALIGYPVALVYLGASAGWQRVILFVVILPLLTSVVVRTFAWIVILGREGVINQTVLWLGLVPAPLRLLQTEHGLVLALTQIEMPLLLLPLLSVMSRLDPNLRDASAGLGATPRRR